MARAVRIQSIDPVCATMRHLEARALWELANLPRPLIFLSSRLFLAPTSTSGEHSGTFKFTFLVS
jgi:hypothetical protein